MKIQAGKFPIPAHFDPARVGEIWKVPYSQRELEARDYAKEHSVKAACEDRFRTCIVAVDMQNTFCTPGFELYVAGRTGTGAIDDTRRLCEFIYRNLGLITQISPTMDSHHAMQIFHPLFLVNERNEHPFPFTLVTEEDIRNGVWRFNPDLCFNFSIDEEYGQDLLLHYARELKKGGKYDLTIWPYHAMLGGIGHALVSSLEETVFFHCVARYSQPDFHIKGDRPFTEHYSVLGPEVQEGPKGEQLGVKSDKFFRKLIDFDAVIIAGEAKSHCVAWTIADLLEDILAKDRKLVEKVYLLDDCTSAVVVPGVMDYTEAADAAFKRFADAGMHIVRSTDPIESWPGVRIS